MQKRDPVAVTAAILFHQGRLLAARRPEGKARAGLWELPGGKQEPGETLEACLARELREELGIEVAVGEPFQAVTHDYPDLQVQLHAFRCRWVSGLLSPTEHDRVRWLALDELDAIAWSPADRPIVTRLRQVPRP